MSLLAEQEYWRSLEELAGTPEYRELLKREFPEGADRPPGELSRRRFLQLMGASIALAGFSGCRWPKEEIVPYAHRPEGAVPGSPRRFATTFEVGGWSNGILVTSYDGRPVKIEGNPSHPMGRGTTDLLAQASVLELYDPDRSKRLVRRAAGQEVPATWDDFGRFIRKHTAGLWERGGDGLHILTEATSSPSVADLKRRLLHSFPHAAWYEYEPISWDNARQGADLALGQPLRIHYEMQKARVILSLDDDLFGANPTALKNARDFMEGRNPEQGSMNRLYVVESAYSTTGTVADHRLGLPASQIEEFALDLLGELIRKQGLALHRLFGDVLRPPGEETPHHKLIQALAADLMANRGRSIVTAGHCQQLSLHTLVHLLNHALGNVGGTVYYTEDPDPQRPSHSEAIQTIAIAMADGEVDTLVMLGGNPAFDAPAEWEFGKWLREVPVSIHLSLFRNETSRLCNWHLPRAHYLETWGDARAYDGTYTTVQPLIDPLYGGKSPIELLAVLMGEQPQRGYDIVRRTIGEALDTGPDFEKFWRRALHDGVVGGTSYERLSPSLDEFVVAVIQRMCNRKPWHPTLSPQEPEVVFFPDQSLYDGRFANNGWLQELPDHLTKLTWDNAALLSPSTAQELGVVTGDLLRIRRGEREIEIPAYIMPGQPANSIALSLGYGRTAAGHVGSGVGVDVYKLRTRDAFVGFGLGATVEKVGKKYELACTQDHHFIDSAGRKARQQRLSRLVREASIEEYRNDPVDALHHDHHPPLVSLWEEPSFEGHAWGMATDLGRCTGCNACIVACQAENNIPVVGKDEVRRGREMHWIRIDRYFKGEKENPDVLNQPLTCQQCENAPCEEVCPVGATQHSEEGLNDMVYNRCIGTRYCSNNCPYKVRRFNFFNNQKHLEEIEKMVYNPNVTPRSRGVMEKCTFCVQRIQRVKIEAKNKRRPIEDGEITPACAQACPTRAITFGDLADEKSRVSKRHADDRAYYMLAELNIKPRNAFLARIKNPNPELMESGHARSHG